MDRTNLIRMLVIAAALAVAGRRWRVPYLQAAVRIVVGSVLFGYAQGFEAWTRYLFEVLGVTWIVLGASDIWRQRTTRSAESS
jgi:hypothetical protein